MNTSKKSLPELVHLLDLALHAGQEACKEVMAVYASGATNISNKSDGSPVTDADLRAHTLIYNFLSTSGLPVLSEEAVLPFEERCNWKSFWLVDPLDGTKDFISRNDEFTVNIALIEDGSPVLGVVAAPALNRTWYASGGGGAWEIRKGKKTEISALAPWPAESRMFTSYFHDVPATMEFRRLNGIVHTFSAGAASKLARIAASEAEFYPRFVGTSEWDTAAGDAILREAGGLMRTISGELPTYNTPSLRNPFFVAWRPPVYWEDIKLGLSG
jgi:3'(2'), 5'-bisphosphate nucleotidase